MHSNFVFDLLIGNSRWVKGIRRRILQLASYNFNVHIQGEPGTGKHLIANAIHRHSRRGENPFIPVRCDQLTGSFFDQQVFGIPGLGLSSSLGCLRAAEGGTILFAEIERLSLASQRKLAHVLRQKTTDVRVACSSVRDLQEEIRQGRFLPELYAIVSTTTVETQPLKFRPEDFESLVTHFLSKATLERGMPPIRLSPVAYAMLKSHPWPGNVGELEEVIVQAVNGLEFPADIQPHALNLLWDNGISTETRCQPNRNVAAEQVNAFESVPSSGAVRGHWATLAEIESTHIFRTLRETNFDLQAAAELLGINDKALADKMSFYGVNQIPTGLLDP